jgi:preprotein translocase subunit SecB
MNLSTPEVDLLKYALRNISVAWIVDKEHENMQNVLTEGVRTAFDYEVFSDNENPRRYAMNLKIRFETTIGEKQIGYKIDSLISGVFEVREDVPKDNVAYLVRVNAVAALYGILRGIVGTITATFGTGAFFAPSVMPHEIVQVTESNKAAFRKFAERAKAAQDPSAAPVKP